MIACPVLGRYGRLGNQLWEIAGTAGIANFVHDVPAFPEDWKYRDIFRVPNVLFYPPSALSSMPEVVNSPQLVHINPRHRYYMQDMNLWFDIEARLRTWFSMSIKAMDLMSQRYGWLAELPRPVTGVHVRRGDYVGQRWHFPPPTNRYYQDGVRSFAPASVVVFSDDIDWCRRHLELPGDVHYFVGGDPMLKEEEPGHEAMVPTDWHDLFALMLCDSFVLSNSTFGWWAAWLSGSDQVIYPKPWFGEALADIDSSLMFTNLPKWVEHAY